MGQELVSPGERVDPVFLSAPTRPATGPKSDATPIAESNIAGRADAQNPDARSRQGLAASQVSAHTITKDPLNYWWLQKTPGISEKTVYAFIEAAINRSRTTLLIMGMIVLAGIIARAAIPVANDPDIDVPFFVVNVIHEGISPEDAERLLVMPLEIEIRDVEGIEEMTYLPRRARPP